MCEDVATSAFSQSYRNGAMDLVGMTGTARYAALSWQVALRRPRAAHSVCSNNKSSPHQECGLDSIPYRCPPSGIMRDRVDNKNRSRSSLIAELMPSEIKVNLQI
jgi:hypothetical protein